SHSTSVLLPTPVFFRFGDSTLKVRDTEVNSFDRYSDSREISDLAAKLGPPALFQRYTAVTDAMAVVRLVQFLTRQKASSSVLSTSDFTVEQMEESRCILLGTAGISGAIQELLSRVNYEPIARGDLIRNRKPQAGERAEYVQRSESVSR